MTHSHTLKFNNKSMHCTRCEDSGYIFDTLYPCDECDLGKPIQHQHDKDELSRIMKRANTLRINILKYKKENPKEVST